MIRKALHILRHHITAKRTANIFVSVLSYGLSLLFRRPIILGRPVLLMVEPTNLCNLRCPLCPAGSNTLSRPRGKMPLDEFVRLVDENAGHLLLLSLWNIGEPLLHEEFMEMIRYAKRKNLYVITSTNGQTLHREGIAEELVHSGLDELIISLDGVSPETYHLYRQSGNIEHVIEGIRLVVAEKKRLNVSRPRLDLQFIVMRHNEHEIERVQTLTGELGVDLLTLKTVQVGNEHEAEAFLPAQEKLRRYRYENGKLRMKGRIRNQCRWLWLCPVVNWDGTVVGCCFDKDNASVLGQISEQTRLSDIWRGPAYQAMRKRILQDRKRIALCTNCSEGLKGMFLRRVHGQQIYMHHGHNEP